MLPEMGLEQQEEIEKLQKTGKGIPRVGESKTRSQEWAGKFKTYRQT